jgi:LacI family transcriptional regulator
MDIPITDRLAHTLDRDDVPTVVVEYPQPGISCVFIDNEEGGRIAARYLVERGHRRCAFLGLLADPEPHLGSPSIDELRLHGFKEGLAQAGIDLPDCYVRRAPVPSSSRDREAGVFREAVHRAAHALLEIDPPPSAIFANFDLSAAVVLSVARERGLRVPDDLAIIGFDDAEFAAFLGLTTVRQHLAESGRVAFDLLHDRIRANGGGIPKTVTLPLTVISRGTA